MGASKFGGSGYVRKIGTTNRSTQQPEIHPIRNSYKRGSYYHQLGIRKRGLGSLPPEANYHTSAYIHSIQETLDKYPPAD